MENLFLTIVLAPLVGSLLAGLFGKQIGRTASHWVTISGVALSCALSFYVMKLFVMLTRVNVRLTTPVVKSEDVTLTYM